VSELPIAARLENTLMTCLEKDPTRRIPSALALDAELGTVLCERAWTTEQAREWWDAHAPELVVEPL